MTDETGNDIYQDDKNKNKKAKVIILLFKSMTIK